MPFAIRKTAILAARWSAIALGFSLPISAALDNVLVAAFILACLASGKLRELAAGLRSNAVAVAALVLASVIVLGMVWSPLPVRAMREAAVDAMNFALLPLFMMMFKDDATRRRAISAFLAASALILLVSYLLWTGLVEHLPQIKGDPKYPVAFKYHITHNFLMAIAVLFCALRAQRAEGRMKVLYYVMAALAAFNVLFMIPGRTGQLALAATGFFFAFSRYRWRGMTAAMAVSLFVAAVTWFTPNSVMHQRAAVAWQEASEFRAKGVARDDSSIGLRLEFYRNTLKMIAHRPILGTGTGGFASGYAAVAGAAAVAPHHPHNAFLLIAAELGIVGLIALLALLAVQWMSAQRMPDEMDKIGARAVLLIFIIGGLVSATFTDHAEALFFAWVSGVFWSRVGQNAHC